MRATAAILYEVKKPMVVEDVEVLEPRAHEVLVRWAAVPLKDLNHAFDLMLQGEVERSVVVYE